MSSRYLIVTDGQTDRRTDRRTKAISIPRYALVHRAVKTEDHKQLAGRKRVLAVR